MSPSTVAKLRNRLEFRIARSDCPHREWPSHSTTLLASMDQPTVDGLNVYWISKAAAEAGFKVALSGQGGDELFGGYASHEWFERFSHVASWLKPLPHTVGSRLLDRKSLSFRWRKLSYLFGADDPFVAAQMAVRVQFLETDVSRTVESRLSDRRPRFQKPLTAFASGPSKSRAKTSWSGLPLSISPRTWRLGCFEMATP